MLHIVQFGAAVLEKKIFLRISLDILFYITLNKPENPCLKDAP